MRLSGQWVWLPIALTAAFAVFTMGCSSSSENATRDAAAGPFVTDLIAGAGQGYPVTGEVAGTVTTEQVGSDLVVTFDATGGNTMDGCQLYVGVDAPTTVAPGQFPFKGDAAGGTTYTFTLPMVGVYAGKGNDPDVPYDWTGANLYIAAHAETNVYVSGGTGSGWVVCQGEIDNLGIHAGNSNQGQGELVGNCNISVVGNNLVVTGTCIAPNTFSETHLYVGHTAPTSHSPGQFTYQHSPLPLGTTTDTYTIPLDQIYDQQGGGPVGAECGDTLFIAWHSTTDPGGQSSSAWNDGNRVKFPGHNWKSYASFDLGCCPETSEPLYNEETAWGFDPTGDANVSRDEDGWFETIFDDPRMRWGWVFRYQAD
jgi:hypothetical protein